MRRSAVLLTALVLSCLLSGSASAESKEWVVQFRLPQWKTLHFNSPEKADTHLTTVKKLGCEAAKHDHDGHVDVKYRCPQWKQMNFATDEEAHQWVRWLKQVGFQTIHEH